MIILHFIKTFDQSETQKKRKQKQKFFTKIFFASLYLNICDYSNIN